MDFCSIASGSSGNCIFVGTEHTGVLIDAGISGKRVIAGLNAIDRDPKELDAILVTHEPSDHIKGIGVLARKFGVPIYSAPGTVRAMKAEKSLFLTSTILTVTVLKQLQFMISAVLTHSL